MVEPSFDGMEFEASWSVKGGQGRSDCRSRAACESVLRLNLLIGKMLRSTEGDLCPDEEVLVQEMRNNLQSRLTNFHRASTIPSI